MSVTVGAQASDSIRLVLQITVDGMRYDMLTRTEPHFVEGGFRRLLEHGVLYTNAYYQHANTETIVGHSTLATGTFPSEHGMIGNVWFDSETSELGYNIEDSSSPLLPSRAQSVVGEQVDPAQQLARTQGRSPKNLLAETISDRIAAAAGGKAKVFGVSGKDRGAVALAGHAGTAYWVSSDSGDFVTSSYYQQAYPGWVSDWNDERRVAGMGNRQWHLVDADGTYRYAHQDDRSYETDLGGFGRIFPHTYAPTGHKLLPTQVIASPAGDAITADFAMKLLTVEQLGVDNTPDYLSVSFSGVDAVSHFFGPASLESEDMLRQLDRTIAKLLEHVDDRVGLQHTLVVLSADHGMAELPEYKLSFGIDAGRLFSNDVVKMANDLGRSLYDVDDIVRMYYRPYLYVNRDRLRSAGFVPDDVIDGLAAALTEQRGISLAVQRNVILANQTTDLGRQIQRTYHPTRSGDIYIVQDAYWFNFDSGPVAGMHGSPWNYDTHVPIIFSAAGISEKKIHRRVHPVDVAPTIAAALGISPPAASRGDVLIEVVDR